jgi:Tol biopolymer transport system component
MGVSAGARLGHYEIVGPLGAGAMGEVYRARDPRLGRDVAIKILPPAFAADPDRLHRFEQEARSVATLNHPNIVAIYDVGSADGRPFLVTELLQGETLRDRIQAAPLSLRAALELGAQIAEGLAAAHDKGIVHRDLKPDNVFVSGARRIKILDFGLAKPVGPAAAAGASEPTIAVPGTQTGLLLGTVGYMSPEQVRGEPADHRSDIFSLGAILYELVCGRRAFKAPTGAETMAAILNAEPEPLSSDSRPVSPSVERIIRHCLEKDPRERYQSAHDLAFHLKGALELVDGRGEGAAGAASTKRPLLWAALGVMLAGVAAGIFVGRPVWTSSRPQPPAFHRLTFRSGFVWSARFAPDGRTVVYSAAWGDRPLEIFSTRPESPESRPLDLANASILSVSSSGELAVLLGAEYAGGWSYRGTLARLPLEGGAPREILHRVLWADWAPRTDQLAVVREEGGKRRLEYPIGRVLYQSAGSIREPRFSPDGETIAFLDHPIFGDDRGYVAVVDRGGKVRRLTKAWESIQGIAWGPNGKDVWFTAAEGGPLRTLYVVSPGGKVRTILRSPGSLALQDISSDGRVLLAPSTYRYGIAGRRRGDTKDRDLSWLDWSATRDLSADGKTLLFTEGGEGGGPAYGVYLRKTDGSPAVRLGNGEALALSPDGQWALAVLRGANPHPILLPTGAGQARELPPGAIREYQGGSWMPDGARLTFLGSEPGHGARIYVQSISGGNPTPVTPEGISGFGFGSHTVSPDGRLFTARAPDGSVRIWPVDGGPGALAPGLLADEVPIRWSADGRFLFVALPMNERRTSRITRVDVRTGARMAWAELEPPEGGGVRRVGNPMVSADGGTLAYTYGSLNADLYWVEGLK